MMGHNNNHGYLVQKAHRRVENELPFGFASVILEKPDGRLVEFGAPTDDLVLTNLRELVSTSAARLNGNKVTVIKKPSS